MEIETLLQQILFNQKRIESKLDQLLHSNKIEFEPPTIEKIREYMSSKNISSSEFTAEYFHKYYSAKNWQLGKQTMTSWQKVVDNWHEIEKRKNNNKSKEFNASDRTYSSDDLIQLLSNVDSVRI